MCLTAAVGELRTATAREDFLRQLRMHVLVEVAAQLGSTKLLVGDTVTRLAVQTLAETARGRAAVLSQSIAFKQPRSAGSGAVVNVLRPMRELLSKEVAVYLHYNGLDVPLLAAAPSDRGKANIDRLTESTAATTARIKDRAFADNSFRCLDGTGRPTAFIVGLQKDFPSTVDALSRTVEKMTVGSGSRAPRADGEGSQLCVLCELPLRAGAREWRDRIVVRSPAPDSTAAVIAVEMAGDPAALDRLCYACQTTVRERAAATADPLGLLPPYAASAAADRFAAMRTAIADALLADDNEAEDR